MRAHCRSSPQRRCCSDTLASLFGGVPVGLLFHGNHRKIVGSAQMRTRDGFLQHGSIVLKNDLEKLFAVVRTAGYDSDDAAHRAAQLMTSVSDEAHRTVTFQEMVDALIADFSTLESVKLVPDVLTPDETHESVAICTRKYGCEGWNALR
jgi:lipoate-protein ligase A